MVGKNPKKKGCANMYHEHFCVNINLYSDYLIKIEELKEKIRKILEEENKELKRKNEEQK